MWTISPLNPALLQQNTTVKMRICSLFCTMLRIRELLRWEHRVSMILRYPCGNRGTYYLVCFMEDARLDSLARWLCIPGYDRARSPVLNNHDSACAITQLVDGAKHQFDKSICSHTLF